MFCAQWKKTVDDVAASRHAKTTLDKSIRGLDGLLHLLSDETKISLSVVEV